MYGISERLRFEDAMSKRDDIRQEMIEIYHDLGIEISDDQIEDRLEYYIEELEFKKAEASYDAE